VGKNRFDYRRSKVDSSVAITERFCWWCGADTLVRFLTLILKNLGMNNTPKSINPNFQIKGGGQECPPPHEDEANMRDSQMKPSQPTLLGIPLDANSSYMRGAASAPPLIREAFRCDSSNSSTESGIELGSESVLDAGDLTLPADSAFTVIEGAVGELLDKGQIPVCLGGDHSITYPIVRAFGKRFADLTIVHFDAHPDLYEELDGNRYSHACPFARIMEARMCEAADPGGHSDHECASTKAGGSFRG
jgi:hypothetical protein